MTQIRFLMYMSSFLFWKGLGVDEPAPTEFRLGQVVLVRSFRSKSLFGALTCLQDVCCFIFLQRLIGGLSSLVYTHSRRYAQTHPQAVRTLFLSLATAM